MTGVSVLLLTHLPTDALVELGAALFRELARRGGKDFHEPCCHAVEAPQGKEPLPASGDASPEASDTPPAKQRLRGNVAATVERWKAVATDIAQNGPQPIADLARAHDLTYEGLSYGVRKGSFARWFTVEGGRVYLTNEGRQEALPPKE